MSDEEREAWKRLGEVLLRLDRALEEKPIDWSKVRVLEGLPTDPQPKGKT